MAHQRNQFQKTVPTFSGHEQLLEIDTLLSIHGENLRSELEALRMRHCCGLISSLEQQVAVRLQAKEAELAREMETNALLQENENQMVMQRQRWFDEANKTEAIAAGLKDTLKKAKAKAGIPDDAGSCCFGGQGQGQGENARFGRTCKACGERDVSVLLLPCMHLCACTVCETSISTCPVCHCSLTASFHVLMPCPDST